jgi:tetratricopeptide (TPR) repeat protein
MTAAGDEAVLVPGGGADAEAPDVVGLGDVELLDDAPADWIERGRELYTAGDVAAAAAAFGEAARLDPDSPDAAYALAKALRGIDPAAARMLLERAATARPGAFEYWRALALQCVATHDLAAAERALAGATATGDPRCAALAHDVAAVL